MATKGVMKHYGDDKMNKEFNAPEELSKARVLANEIIDTIEEAIIADHPEIGELIKGYEGHTLLHGIKYYEIEDWIVQRIETGKFKVKHEEELIK